VLPKDLFEAAAKPIFSGQSGSKLMLCVSELRSEPLDAAFGIKELASKQALFDASLNCAI
jgi:hypothetical protein